MNISIVIGYLQDLQVWLCNVKKLVEQDPIPPFDQQLIYGLDFKIGLQIRDLMNVC